MPSPFDMASRYLLLAAGCAVAAVQFFSVFPRQVKHFWQNSRRRIFEIPSSIQKRLLMTGIVISALSLIILFIIIIVPLLAILSPLVMLTFGYAILSIFRQRIPFTVMTEAAIIHHPPGRKLIWLLLDEFDQRLGFESRPAGLHLPNLDAFVETSLLASRATPPCRCTEISIPALLTGRMVKETIVSADDCILCLDSPEKNVALSSCETVFSRAREKGFNCALSGWYHPYDRLIGRDLVDCRWYEPPDQENSLTKHGLQYSFDLLRSLIETSSYSPFGQSLTVQKWIRTWPLVLRDAIEFSTRLDIDLVVLHWTIPHAPYFYDSVTGTMTLKNSPTKGYFGNLVLADKGFGQLLSAIAATGFQKDVRFLISSDHWWRGSSRFDGHVDHRVPFIVNLGNNEKSFTYDKPFNTVLSSELALGILDGRISDTTTLVAWLDAHGKNLEPTKI
jgi:hypothetical protein